MGTERAAEFKAPREEKTPLQSRRTRVQSGLDETVNIGTENTGFKNRMNQIPFMNDVSKCRYFNSFSCLQKTIR